MDVRSGVPCWVRLQAAGPRVTAVAFIAGGFAMILFGYRSLAGSPLPSEQVAYLISAGLGGLFSIVIGVGFLLGAAAHDHRRQLDRLEALLDGVDLPDHEAIVRGFEAGLALEHDNIPPPAPHSRAVIGLFGGIGLLAVVVLVMSWARAAGTTDLGRAADGLVLGLTALLVSAGAVTVAGMRNRAGLVARQRRLLGQFAGSTEEHQVGPVAGKPVGGYWTAPGLSRFHHPSCPAIERLPERRAVRPGDALEACDICQGEELSVGA